MGGMRRLGRMGGLRQLADFCSLIVRLSFAHRSVREELLNLICQLTNLLIDKLFVHLQHINNNR